MAEVKKARLFLRRGTDTDRIATTLCEGELGYSTDAFRVVIGDGSTAGARPVGPVVHVSGGSLALNFQSNLTSASAFNGTGGYAVSGDIAILPAQNYTNAAGSSVTVGSGNVGAPTAATVMVLTGSNAAVSNSWVAVNSGIPWGNLTVQDDDISGDKIHGGVISGPISLSGGNTYIGGVGPSENLILSGTYLSAATLPTNDLVFPVGLTSAAQLTCIDSIYGFGTQTSSSGIGNSTGYVPATGTTSTNVISAFIEAVNYTFTANTSSMGSPGAYKGVSGGSTTPIFTSTGYLGSGGLSASNAGRKYIPLQFQEQTWPKNWIGHYASVAEFNYHEADFQLAAENIAWDSIVEFYFSVFYRHADDAQQFIGFYNHQTLANEILHWNGSSISSGAMRAVPNAVRVTIPNTAAASTATQRYLNIHIGIGHAGAVGFAFTGLRYKW